MAINIFEEKTLTVFGFLNASPMETAQSIQYWEHLTSAVFGNKASFRTSYFQKKPSVTALGETYAIVTANPVMVHPAAQAHPGTARSSPSHQPPSLESWGKKLEKV